jgi:hypothetical protein
MPDTQVNCPETGTLIDTACLDEDYKRLLDGLITEPDRSQLTTDILLLQLIREVQRLQQAIERNTTNAVDESP